MHSHHARHWSHHGTNGVDCTVPRGPTNRQYGPVKPRPTVSVRFLHFSPPLGQLPRAVCAGLFSAFCDLTSLFICPLASHLQCLGSSRYSIPTQHSFCSATPLHVRCSSEFSAASRSYAHTLSDSETQLTNEWFTITDYSKCTVQDAPMVYIYNQM